MRADPGTEGLILFAVLLVCLCIVLPIVAFVRTNRIRSLELRLAGVEAALHRLIRQLESTAQPAAEAPAVEAPTLAAGPPPVAQTAPAAPALPATESLEAVIGQKWVGWIAVLLIFCAAAFFLKYAFENRWIGELGRVSIGVAAGLRCWACASGAPSIWRER